MVGAVSRQPSRIGFVPTDPRVPRSDRPLDQLVAEFATDLFTESPTSATMLGVAGLDDAMPDLSAAAFTRREKADDEWTARFEALADAGLEPAERIDRGLVLAELRGRAVWRSWQRHRRDAEVYGGVGLSGVFGLMLHRPLPPGELARAVVARIAAVPDVLEAGRAQLDAELASPLLVRRAAAQARGGVAYFRDVVPGLLPDVPGLTDVGAVAAKAYEDWASFLDDLADRATGEFAIGEERYSALLREKEGLGYGAAGLAERGRAAHAELVEQIRAQTRELAGHDDWRGYLRELEADAPATPEAMLAGYQAATAAAREFSYAQGLVTEPIGERCEVAPAEEFQRATLAVAFYFSPRPFAEPASLVGHFFVPYPPSNASPEGVRDRLAANSYSAMPAVSVHEAYPGHHWHLSHLAAGNERPARSLLRTPYFVEGWALYAEQALADAGFFTDPKARLRQVDFRLFRAARIVTDVALHTGEWTFDEAVEYMSTQASLTPDVAHSEVARYCAWPTQASSYLTGALEIARLRDRWLAEGRGDLRAFHDGLAGTGGLPVALAEQALFG